MEPHISTLVAGLLFGYCSGWIAEREMVADTDGDFELLLAVLFNRVTLTIVAGLALFNSQMSGPTDRLLRLYRELLLFTPKITAILLLLGSLLGLFAVTTEIPREIPRND